MSTFLLTSIVAFIVIFPILWNVERIARHFARHIDNFAYRHGYVSVAAVVHYGNIAAETSARGYDAKDGIYVLVDLIAPDHLYDLEFHAEYIAPYETLRG